MKHKVFILSILFCVYLASAQKPNVRFIQYYTSDGLPHNKINCIYQDSKGYMWFGTNEGLSRFDGYKFYNYQYNYLTDDGISEVLIRCIFEDSKGNLWIGTDKGGLNLYNRELDNFKHFSDDTLSEIKIQSNTILSIAEDNNNNLWLGTANGLIKFKLENKLSILYKPKPDNQNNYINSLIIDNNNNILIGTGLKGFCVFNQKSEKFKFYIKEENLSNNVLALYKARNDEVWIGCQDGLYKFDHQNDLLKKYSPKALKTTLDRVRAINQDINGNIWIGCQEGLFIYNKNTNQFYRYQHIKIDPTSLSHNSVQSVFRDTKGDMWIGTRTGLNYVNTNNMVFENIIAGKDNQQHLNSEVVYAIIEDSKDNLWIGTEEGGVNFLNNKTGIFRYFENNPKNKNSISGNNIKSLFEDNSGNIWIGTYQHGLNIYNPALNQMRQYFQNSSESVWSIKADRKGIIYLLINRNQIYNYNKKENKFLKSDILNNIKKEFNIINYLYFDNQNNLWLCFSDGSIIYFQKNTNAINSYNLSSKINNQVIKQSITSCIESKSGIFWFGTIGMGLHSLNIKSGKSIMYDMENGLPSNTIYAIQEDKTGNLWLSTNNGLCKFNPENKKIICYYKDNGLQDNQFTDATFLSKNGIMYFGGIKGLTKFNPDSIKSNEYIPPVVITDFKVFNRSVPINDKNNILKKHISETKEIRLSYKFSVFSFEFAALNYALSNYNRYAYKLEGIDNEWVYCDASRRFATYAHIPGGKYKFKVKASNNDGKWSNETSITITIIPPFWKTPWFRILFTLIIFLLILTIYLIRVSALKHQKIKLESQVAQRTSELKKANENIKNISDFGKRITSRLDFDSINQMCHEYIKSFIYSFDFGIGLFDNKNNIIEYRAFYIDGELIPPFIRPLSNRNSFSVFCIENQETIYINDIHEDFKKYLDEVPDFSASRLPNSLINIPLTVEDKKIGLLSINSTKKNAFSEDDILKLETLASYIAVALDNSIAHESLKDKNALLIKRQKQIEKQAELLNETNTILEERQQRIEEQTEEMKVQAEELSKMNDTLKTSNATKDKLFSIIAHDLRNPFGSLIGLTEIINTRYEGFTEQKRKHLISVIYSSAKNIYNLLDNLLLWSRSQSDSIKTDPENIAVHEIVSNNIELLKHLITQKNISTEIRIEKNLNVLADKQMINTILRNLLTNAIKFTEEGSLKIIAEKIKKDIRIDVIDDGTGIPESRVNTLFEVVRSKSTEGTKGEQGTGLGLIICKEFVEINGGSISYKPNTPAGSIFSVTLPSI